MKHPNQSLASTKKSADEFTSTRATTIGVALREANNQFGQFAVVNGLIQEQVLANALAGFDAESQSLGAVLVEQGYLSSEDRQAIEHLLRSPRTPRSSGVATEAGVPAETPAGSANGELETIGVFAPAPHDSLGELGDYDVLSEIARGGMGIVYKARQRKLNRLVALKMIRGGELADEEQIQRFYSEAEAAANLDHPGIVPVYEVGEVNGQHFFSMAFVEGRSLHNEVKLKEGPLEIAEAVSLTRAIAEAVQFAHENGIVHRDIKPQNILLDKQRRPRVTDFGLAKHLLGDSQLTAAGLVMGTPSFMAPEQAEGNAHLADASADVYAIGATLYYLLTARPPTQAASTMETLRQVVETDPAPPRQLNPAIPRDVETICLKCLQKSPAKRYASAAELADDLGRWIEKKPIRARRANMVEKIWLWRQRKPATAAAILIVLLVVLLTGAIVYRQHGANRARIQAAERKNDAQRAGSLVENMLVAPAAGVPYAIDLLAPLKSYAQPLLEERFNDSSQPPRQRLHAAVALARWGDVRGEFLVSMIPTADSGECANLIAALGADPKTVRLVQEHAAAAVAADPPDWQSAGRLAMMAIYLGDASFARQICQHSPDPAPRTQWIALTPVWHGDLRVLAELLRKDNDPALRYALILGAAQLQEPDVSPAEAADWISLLTELEQSAADPAVHSAAQFALRHGPFGAQPSLTMEEKTTERWKVNSLGMTLLKVPAGKFLRSTKGKDYDQQVTISRDFWLADRETTNAAFQEYLREREPADPSTATVKLTGKPEQPADGISWDEAVRFCNWLSRREQLPECYQWKDGGWRWDQAASGYRLPTESEWELACRANSKTRFAYGDGDRYLPQYAVIDELEKVDSGARLPNAFGFFDMPGSLEEWCFDEWTRNLADAPQVVDPVGPIDQQTPPALLNRVTRGGSYNSTAYSMRSDARAFNRPQAGIQGLGFRVAQSASTPADEKSPERLSANSK